MVKRIPRMRDLYLEDRIPDPLGPSILLVGPTPNRPRDQGWRMEALNLIDATDVRVTVLCPEYFRTPAGKGSYEDQLDWEDEALASATVLLFFFPRETDSMLGLDATLYWGRYSRATPERCVLGAPDWAVHTRLLARDCERYHISFASTLAVTVANALVRLDALTKPAKTATV